MTKRMCSNQQVGNQRPPDLRISLGQNVSTDNCQHWQITLLALRFFQHTPLKIGT